MNSREMLCLSKIQHSSLKSCLKSAQHSNKAKKESSFKKKYYSEAFIGLGEKDPQIVLMPFTWSFIYDCLGK